MCVCVRGGGSMPTDRIKRKKGTLERSVRERERERERE